MANYLYTNHVQVLTVGARSTYYAVIGLVSSGQRNNFDRDIKIFDVVPSSTYYRHRKEILDKTGLDLNSFFQTSKPIINRFS